MHQLFGNLISNALKFVSHEAGPKIVVDSKALGYEQAGRYINDPKSTDNYHHITVSDNGIGFEKQYADHIFEIFKRLHVRTEYKGSGIGLALCKRIVTNHKGHIFAESTPGEGSTFHIFLPAREGVKPKQTK